LRAWLLYGGGGGAGVCMRIIVAWAAVDVELLLCGIGVVLSTYVCRIV
jgi:hypothetical protein